MAKTKAQLEKELSAAQSQIEALQSVNLVTFAARIPATLRHEVRRKAADTGQSMQAIMTEALTDWLAKG